MPDAPIIEGLYVHIPFCDGKCHYCAFYSVPYSHSLASGWLAKIKEELNQAIESYGTLPLTSVFMGGGTPSILPLEQLKQLMNILQPQVREITRGLEWTSEANPGSLTLDKLKLMKEFGVNRISLGVQAMNDTILSQLGRRHSVADIYSSVQAIYASGITNFGFDLIACIPGMSERTWKNTLETAINLGPKHISVYALTNEEGSRLHKDCEAGLTKLLDDEKQLRMLDVAEEMLVEAGFNRYEISNYARPGFECQHNLSCWHGRNYLGLGCAAASRVHDQRWTNTADINAYISGNSEKERETLTPLTDAVERLVFGLRLQEGINLNSILAITGMTTSDQAKIWQSSLAKLERNRLVEHCGGRWRLTSKGRALADYVAVELMP